MGFSLMMELLQKENKGKIVICNLGSFYISIGRDAVLLNKILGIKVSCLKSEICKIGFPINSLEKYTGLMQQKRYSYIVYYFDQQKEELKILEDYQGINENKLTDTNINCYICNKNILKYKEPDKYIKALSKLHEKEELYELNNRESVNNKINQLKIEDGEEKRKIWFQNRNKKTN